MENKEEISVDIKKLFPIEKEYDRCVDALKKTSILTRLATSEDRGVIGLDGKDYPLPTKEQILELFEQNSELVSRKVAQGFDRLELTPLAMSIPILMELMEASIIRHTAKKIIFQTRKADTDPLVPVVVNKEKYVIAGEALRDGLEANGIIYFPKEYSNNHGGQTKEQIINNGNICAFPGWSVGLVESFPIIPERGQGKKIEGRKQLEVGSSPTEYLQALKADVYEGESGKTIEDFIIKFLTHLEETNEVSNDVEDNNALWCLAQYIKVPSHQLVPSGRWFHSVGRVRLDTYRANNKDCIKSWGAATTVRLVKPE